MTQSATFLPPVLAVGSDASQNGRNRLGSGLVTHRGIIDSNVLRASGLLNPQSGAGLELMFSQTVPKTAFVSGFDRDANDWTDLYLRGKNVALQTNSGGKASLPAGTAQALIGQYAGTTSWAVPAPNAWYESDARCNFTATGGVLRLEYSFSVSATAASQGLLACCGLDGGASGTQHGLHIPVAGTAVAVAGVIYYSGIGAGLHRASIFLYAVSTTNGLAFHNWGTQSIWVTEQRA